MVTARITQNPPRVAQVACIRDDDDDQYDVLCATVTGPAARVRITFEDLLRGATARRSGDAIIGVDVRHERGYIAFDEATLAQCPYIVRGDGGYLCVRDGETADAIAEWAVCHYEAV